MPSVPQEKTIPAKPKPPTAHELEKTELGCMLGAFRDVAHSIGMQVMAVTLQVGGSPVAKPKPNTPVLGKKRSRRDKKLIALIQTFADNVLLIGFALTNIDMKPVPKGRPTDRKLWCIRVNLVAMPPSEQPTQ